MGLELTKAPFSEKHFPVSIFILRFNFLYSTFLTWPWNFPDFSTPGAHPSYRSQTVSLRGEDRTGFDSAITTKASGLGGGSTRARILKHKLVKTASNIVLDYFLIFL